VIFFEEFVRVKPHYKKDLLRTFYWNIQVFSFLNIQVYFIFQLTDYWGRFIEMHFQIFEYFFDFQVHFSLLQISFF
jgi:hypothetical protein